MEILSLIVYLGAYYTILFFPSLLLEMSSEEMDVLKNKIANKILTCTSRKFECKWFYNYFVIEVPSKSVPANV